MCVVYYKIILILTRKIYILIIVNKGKKKTKNLMDNKTKQDNIEK